MNGSDITTAAILATVSLLMIVGLPWYTAVPVGIVLALPALLVAWVAFVLLSAGVARVAGWLA